MPKFSLEQFKRNRYFYGKLLTVSDFELEQDYMNDKRHMLNALVGGSGIVKGLELSINNNEDVKFNLTAGMAVDREGREIVVPNDKNGCDFSNISILDNHTLDPAEVQYLCLKYAEDKEPVFSPAPPNPNCSAAPCAFCEEICERNRILERYDIFIKQVDAGKDVEKGSQDGQGILDLWIDKRLIYYIENPANNSEYLKVYRYVPKWVNPGEILEVRIKVVACMDGNTLAVNFVDRLPGLTPTEAGSGAVIQLDGSVKIGLDVKTQFSAGAEFDIIYYAKAPDYTTYSHINSIDESISMNPMLPQNTSFVKSTVSDLEVTDGNILDIVVDEYFKQDAKDMTGTEENFIYLAKLSVTRKEVDGAAKYFFSKDLDFVNRDYVYNNELLYKLLSITGKRIGPQGPQGAKGADGTTTTVPAPAAAGIATGIVDFKVNGAVEATSGKIDPKLGTGNICVQLGFEKVFSTLDPDTVACMGTDEYLKSSKYFEQITSKVSCGAVVYPTEGRFKIGLISKAAGQATYRVRWWAFKPSSEDSNPVVVNAEQNEVVYLTISVDNASAPYSVNEGEKIQIKAAVTVDGSVNNSGVTWSLESGNIGAIDQNGLYTAPKVTADTKVIIVAASKYKSSVIAKAELTVKNLAVQVKIDNKGSFALTTSLGTSIKFNNAILIGSGDVQQLTATVSGCSDKKVIWSGTNISAAGEYTAPTLKANEQYITNTATATSNFDGTAKDTVTVVVGRQGMVDPPDGHWDKPYRPKWVNPGDIRSVSDLSDRVRELAEQTKSNPSDLFDYKVAAGRGIINSKGEFVAALELMEGLDETTLIEVRRKDTGELVDKVAVRVAAG